MKSAVPVLGSLRGYRWWRFDSNMYGADPALLSPYRQRIRWRRDGNEARCLGRKRIIGWTTTNVEHPTGAPEAACACGFYALGSITKDADRQAAYVSDIDVEISGRSGLVLGVMEGFGRVLVGTSGLRAQFARVMALFVSSRLSDVPRPLQVAGEVYDVPVYRRLSALTEEWGPESWGTWVAELESA
jgi:hypothetical protein